ncbi:uncharacterized protein LOC142634406 [Castanea sativa]|uniref:uncharacterized protein LOC142634406 n=1 Tax=Castanea sativa TaxID=21020 RepID=UPI003F64FAA0
MLIIDEMALEDFWLDLIKFVLADLSSLRFCIALFNGICYWWKNIRNVWWVLLFAMVMESCTGMDPLARRFMWEVISRLSTRLGKIAVILTTHYMNEAQALCTRIG